MCITNFSVSHLTLQAEIIIMDLITFVSFRRKDFWRKGIQMELTDGYRGFVSTSSFYCRIIEMEGISKAF